MSDKPIIIAGLVVFLGLATFPLWYTLGYEAYSPGNALPLELEPPAGALRFSAEWPEDDVDLEGLRKELENHQVSLSDEATLSEEEQGDPWSKWRIIDKETPYLAVKNQGTLEVSDSTGAILFSIDWSAVRGDAAEDIDWKRLQEEFKKQRIAFSDQARLIKEEQGDRWRIDTPSRYLVLKMKDQETVEIYDGCIEDKDFMAANHMNLLIAWRQAVVRQADKSQIEINGEKYPKSLTKGCMECHNSRENFCARCHEYMDVQQLEPLPELATAQQTQRGIRCWSCHVAPKGD